MTSPWDKHELSALSQLIEMHGDADWNLLADKFNQLISGKEGRRSAVALSARWQAHLRNPGGARSADMARARDMFNPGIMLAGSSMGTEGVWPDGPARLDVPAGDGKAAAGAAAAAAAAVMPPKGKPKGKETRVMWKKGEDDLLKALIAKHGTTDWPTICAEFNRDCNPQHHRQEGALKGRLRRIKRRVSMSSESGQTGDTGLLILAAKAEPAIITTQTAAAAEAKIPRPKKKQPVLDRVKAERANVISPPNSDDESSPFGNLLKSFGYGASGRFSPTTIGGLDLVSDDTTVPVSARPAKSPKRRRSHGKGAHVKPSEARKAAADAVAAKALAKAAKAKAEAEATAALAAAQTDKPPGKQDETCQRCTKFFKSNAGLQYHWKNNICIRTKDGAPLSPHSPAQTASSEPSTSPSPSPEPSAGTSLRTSRSAQQAKEPVHKPLRPPRPPPTVIVIGAGAAGLSAARALQDSGKCVPIVLEAQDHVGGRARTVKWEYDGKQVAVDLGAAFIHGCNMKNPMWVLAKRNKAKIRRNFGGYSQGWSTKCKWYDSRLSEMELKRVATADDPAAAAAAFTAAAAEGEAAAAAAAAESALASSISTRRGRSKDQPSPAAVLMRPHSTEPQNHVPPSVVVKAFELSYAVWDEMQGMTVEEVARHKGANRRSTAAGVLDVDSATAYNIALERVLARRGSELGDLEGEMLRSTQVIMWGYVSQLRELSFREQLNTAKELAEANAATARQLQEAAAAALSTALSTAAAAAATPAARPAALTEGDMGAAAADTVVTVHPDTEPALDTSDGFVVDGYGQLLIDQVYERGSSRSCQRPLDDVRLNTVVTAVRSNAEGCEVVTSTGAIFKAAYVVCTVPLGVLKGKIKTSVLKFSPPLSRAKLNAIDRMGYGVENKVVLTFTCDRFWPNEPYFQCSDPRFRFMNLDFFGKPGMLAVHLQPPFSEGYDGLNDAELIAEICATLRRMFGDHTPATPTFYHVTRWDEDAFAGGGSYSFMKVGATAQDIRELSRPEGGDGAKKPRLYFAGEACSETNGQCVHGAYATGELAGQTIVQNVIDDSPKPVPRKRKLGDLSTDSVPLVGHVPTARERELVEKLLPAPLIARAKAMAAAAKHAQTAATAAAHATAVAAAAAPVLNSGSPKRKALKTEPPCHKPSVLPVSGQKGKPSKSGGDRPKLASTPKSPSTPSSNTPALSPDGQPVKRKRGRPLGSKTDPVKLAKLAKNRKLAAEAEAEAAAAAAAKKAEKKKLKDRTSKEKDKSKAKRDAADKDPAKKTKKKKKPNTWPTPNFKLGQIVKIVKSDNTDDVTKEFPSLAGKTATVRSTPSIPAKWMTITVAGHPGPIKVRSSNCVGASRVVAGH